MLPTMRCSPVQVYDSKAVNIRILKTVSSRKDATGKSQNRSQFSDTEIFNDKYEIK